MSSEEFSLQKLILEPTTAKIVTEVVAYSQRYSALDSLDIKELKNNLAYKLSEGEGVLELAGVNEIRMRLMALEMCLVAR